MEDRTVQDLEGLLVELTPQADREFYLSLRQDILRRSGSELARNVSRTPRLSRIRYLRAAVALFLLSFLVLALTPAGRTFAQDALRLGVFFVTQNLTAAERWLAGPPAEEEIVHLDSRPAALEEASGLAGYPVYYPAYLPAGYEPDSGLPVKIVYNTQGGVKSVEATFTSEDGRYLLYYSQALFPPDAELSDMPLDAGDAQVEQARVRGNDALWLTDFVWGTAKDSQGSLQPARYNVLMWTQPASDGSKYYFWLGSEEKLPQAEMIRIAESMAAD